MRVQPSSATTQHAIKQDSTPSPFTYVWYHYLVSVNLLVCQLFFCLALIKLAWKSMRVWPSHSTRSNETGSRRLSWNFEHGPPLVDVNARELAIKERVTHARSFNLHQLYYVGSLVLVSSPEQAVPGVEQVVEVANFFIPDTDLVRIVHPDDSGKLHVPSEIYRRYSVR